MNKGINVIFFDLGGTLRLLGKDAEHQARATRRIAELLGAKEEPERFLEILNARYDEYRKEIFATNREATEYELWTKWMAPDADRALIRDNCVELSFQYRQTTGKRYLAPNARETVEELHRRGYAMGIISNLITTREVPDWLEESGLGGYFNPVLLSAVIGLRKPDPEIYRYACRELNAAPAQCASVADNLDRDITGAKAAGIGMNVLYITPEKLATKTVTDANRPDAYISDFLELLDIFPPLEKEERL